MARLVTEYELMIEHVKVHAHIDNELRVGVHQLSDRCVAEVLPKVHALEKLNLRYLIHLQAKIWSLKFARCYEFNPLRLPVE